MRKHGFCGNALSKNKQDSKTVEDVGLFYKQKKI